MTAREAHKTLGTIDTLAAGFTLVGKNLWLMAIPILLDVLLWIAPKLSVAPVVAQVTASLRDGLATLGAKGGVDVGVSEMFESLGASLQASAGRANVLATLTWGRLGVPGVASLRQIRPATDRVLELNSYGQWIGVEAALLLIGLLLACAFLAMIAQTVGGEKLDMRKLVRRLPTHWLRLLVLLVPLAFVLMTVLGSSVVLGDLSFLMWAVMIWALVYVSFVPQAIIMSEQPALRAVVVSMTVVRQSFWPSFWLLVLVNVINLGLSTVWARVLGSNVGMAATILLNAYIGTSLTAARFIYYRDRVAALRAAAQR